MFKAKTLLVIGAGASCEANLPSGEELKHRIAKILDIKFERFNRQVGGDPRIVEAIHKFAGGDITGVNPYIPKAHRIRDVVPSAAISIDNYLDAHKGDAELELCGKLAIVKSILDAEASSKMKRKDQYLDEFVFDNLKETWYISFLKMLTENVRRDNIASIFENVSIITFNYDRCIERYLVQGLSHYYGLAAQEAQQIVATLRIVHPYGKVGFLPWQGHPGVPFGDHARADLLAISREIKTFTEGLDDQAMVAEMQGMVAGAENIVFLGFSFHPQNLELIKVPAGKTAARRLFATVLGASPSDQGAIKASVAAILNRAVNVHYNDHVEADKLQFDFLNATCSMLFQEYWRSLSAPPA
jgi:hypothetical protein